MISPYKRLIATILLYGQLLMHVGCYNIKTYRYGVVSSETHATVAQESVAADDGLSMSESTKNKLVLPPSCAPLGQQSSTLSDQVGSSIVLYSKNTENLTPSHRSSLPLVPYLPPRQSTQLLMAPPVSQASVLPSSARSIKPVTSMSSSYQSNLNSRRIRETNVMSNLGLSKNQFSQSATGYKKERDDYYKSLFFKGSTIVKKTKNDKDDAQKKELSISLQGGKCVKFNKINEIWSATVQDVLTRQVYAPRLYLLGNYRVENILQTNPVLHSRRIHLIPPIETSDKKGLLVMGEMGLRGGGNSHSCSSSFYCGACGYVCPNNACNACCIHRADHNCWNRKAKHALIRRIEQEQEQKQERERKREREREREREWQWAREKRARIEERERREREERERIRREQERIERERLAAEKEASISERRVKTHEDELMEKIVDLAKDRIEIEVQMEEVNHEELLEDIFYNETGENNIKWGGQLLGVGKRKLPTNIPLPAPQTTPLQAMADGTGTSATSSNVRTVTNKWANKKNTKQLLNGSIASNSLPTHGIDSPLSNSGSIIKNDRDVGKTPLHWAAIMNNYQSIKELLQKGNTDLHAQDEVGATPLHYAASNNYVACILPLVQHGAHSGVLDNRGFNPWHLAAQSGHVNAIQTLNRYGTTQVLGINYFTPFHIAVQHNRKEVFPHLLAGGISINQPADQGLTPLHLAIQSKAWESVLALLAHGSSLLCKDYKGRTPLSWALKQDAPDILATLIAAGGVVNSNYSHDLDKSTLLGYAMQKGRAACMTTLLNHGADMGQMISNNQGVLPLHWTIQQNNGLLFHKLCTNRELLQSRDMHGNTPLHVAIQANHNTFIATLLAKEAPLDLQNKQGNTPLHTAIKKGNDTVVVQLIEQGASIWLPNKWGDNVVDRVLDMGNQPLFKTLLTSTTRPVTSAIWSKTLLKACSHGYGWAIQPLLDKQYGLSAQDPYLPPIIDFALESRQVELLPLLVDQGGTVNRPDEWGVTPLHTAVIRQDLKLVTKLLQSGAQVVAPDLCKNTPLHHAVLGGNSEIITLLAQQGGKSALTAQDSWGQTPLHVAVNKGDMTSLKVLLAAGGDVNSVDKYRRTLLYWASKNGFLEFVQLLLAKGAEVDKGIEDGSTPLHVASEHGHTSCVELLLAKGAEVDKETKDGSTPLHVAVANRNQACVQMLVLHGANSRIKAKDGKIPLDIAQEKGDKILLFQEESKCILDYDPCFSIEYLSAAATPTDPVTTANKPTKDTIPPITVPVAKNQQKVTAVVNPLQFYKHSTKGDGDCAFHAILGKLENGTYYAPGKREVFIAQLDGIRNRDSEVVQLIEQEITEIKAQWAIYLQNPAEVDRVLQPHFSQLKNRLAVEHSCAITADNQAIFNKTIDFYSVYKDWLANPTHWLNQNELKLLCKVFNITVELLQPQQGHSGTSYGKTIINGNNSNVETVTKVYYNGFNHYSRIEPDYYKNVENMVSGIPPVTATTTKGNSIKTWQSGESCNYYNKNKNITESATIVKVYYDDIEPYYTIRLQSNQSERQVSLDRLNEVNLTQATIPLVYNKPIFCSHKGKATLSPIIMQQLEWIASALVDDKLTSFKTAIAKLPKGIAHDQMYELLKSAYQSSNPFYIQSLLATTPQLDPNNSQVIDLVATATKKGHLAAMKALIAGGASIEIQNQEGDLPLTFAAKKEDLDMVQLLLQAGADVNIADLEGKTALYYALKKENKELVKELVIAGGKIKSVGSSQWQQSLLHEAVKDGDTVFIKALLVAVFPVTIKDSEDRTPLAIAAKKGDLVSMEYLLADYVISTVSVDYYRMPLFAAIEGGQLSALVLLLNKGASVHVVHDDRRTPVYIAAQNGYLDCLTKLIEVGASISKINEDDPTPVYIAAATGHLSCLKALIAAGATINDQNYDGQTPLFAATYNHHLSCINTLVANGANIDRSNLSGNTPLHVAVLHGSMEVVELLINKGANLDIKNKNGETPVELAYKTANAGSGIAMLFSQVRGGNNPINHLHLAAYKGNVAKLAIILESGASVDETIEYGATPLHIAAQQGHMSCIELLLAKGATIDQKDTHGKKPLHIAIANKDFPCIQALVAGGAQVNINTNDGTTPLHLAVQEENLHCIDALLKAGAKLNKQDNVGNTPLHLVIATRNEATLTRLLEAKLDLNLKNQEGKTPLFLAIARGDVELAKALVYNGATIDTKDKHGTYAIHVAADDGDADCLSLLLNNKANKNIRNTANKTALELAKAGSHTECIRLLQ